jgi:hypothetical protein
VKEGAFPFPTNDYIFKLLLAHKFASGQLTNRAVTIIVLPPLAKKSCLPISNYIHTGAQQMIISIEIRYSIEHTSSPCIILLHSDFIKLWKHRHSHENVQNDTLYKTSKPVLTEVLLQASFNCSTFDYKEHGVDTLITTCTDFYYSCYF